MSRLACLVAIALLAAGCDPSIPGPSSDGGFSDAGDGGGGEGGVSCEPPSDRCGSRCINTLTSPQHCGGCNQPCSGGAFCQDGECVRTCTGGLVSCGSSCVDTGTDPEHCGECDSACDGGRVCIGGACVCDEGLTECGGECVDTANEASHCGECGNTCEASESCSAGECLPMRETDCNDGADDDGDGMTDCADPDCEGATRTCMGVCGKGVETCQADGSWSDCEGGDGGEEICGDGIDQDCDGEDLRNPDFYDPNEVCAECPYISDTPDPNKVVPLRFDSVDDRVDCFKFDAIDNASYFGAEHIIVAVEDIPEGHDYDVYLYPDLSACESHETIGASFASGNEDELIDWTEERGISGADDSGTYYIRVVRYSGHSCTEGYDLRVNGLN